MSSLLFLRGLINERLTAAAEEIFTHVENIIVQYEEEVDRQRKLLVVCHPQVKLQRIELPQQHVYNEDEEEEVLSEQQVCNQEKNSRLDQEEPESLQIKEEEEEICTSQEQLELKQEADTFMLTPDDEESDHMKLEPGTDHQLSHSPPIVESRDQTVHMREIRSKKSHMCNICKKPFGSKSNLVNHMRTHSSERPYSCETCGKCFRQIGPLIQHRKTHTGEKPYVCSVCKTYFGHKSTLIKHMRTHTGEKPYSCELCGKCFRQSSHLILHKRTHTGERPYACSICEKCFVQKVTLKKHMRTHK